MLTFQSFRVLLCLKIPRDYLPLDRILGMFESSSQGVRWQGIHLGMCQEEESQIVHPDQLPFLQVGPKFLWK